MRAPCAVGAGADGSPADPSEVARALRNGGRGADHAVVARAPAVRSDIQLCVVLFSYV